MRENHSEMATKPEECESVEAVLSYAKGHPTDPEMPEMTAFAYLDKWAEIYPQKDAYVVRFSDTDRETITWEKLKRTSENLAVWLKNRFGLSRGDRVGILSLNRLSMIVCDFALQRLGVVSVLLYATMDSKVELTNILASTECRLLLCEFGSMSSVRAVLPSLKEHDQSQKLSSAELHKLDYVCILTGEHAEGCSSLPKCDEIAATAAELAALRQDEKKIALDDDCTIYTTSGSTGTPKFVVYSYARAMCGWETLKRAGFTTEDRYFSDRPLAHIDGNVLSSLRYGATMVIANTRKAYQGQDPSVYLMKVFKEESVTCGVSSLYTLFDIVKGGGDQEFRNLGVKFFFFAGQTTNTEMIGVVKDKLGIPLFNVFSCTETGAMSCTTVNDTLDVTVKYVGLVLPGVEVKIVNPDNRLEILPRGAIGSLAIRKRYKWRYLFEQATAFDSDRYFYPGDMARMEANGYIEILGRADDRINVDAK